MAGLWTVFVHLPLAIPSLQSERTRMLQAEAARLEDLCGAGKSTNGLVVVPVEELQSASDGLRRIAVRSGQADEALSAGVIAAALTVVVCGTVLISRGVERAGQAGDERKGVRSK